MSITINAKGTSVPSFTIGKGGVTLYQGTTDPTSVGSPNPGDYWFNANDNSLSVLSSGTWTPPKLNQLTFPTGTGSAGQTLVSDGAGNLTFSTPSGSGTVTSVSVVSAHGFAGTVATSTSTPAITISTSVTGVIKGDGTSISAATAGDFPTLNQNTTGSAATLTTARTISTTGDATWSVSFNGSANQSAAITLATVNSNVGTFGSATQVPSFTVNGKGLITAASQSTLSTSNIVEGSNLYYTDTRAQNAISVSGNGLSYSAGVITSNAASANTASTIVFRDSSGNFAAGTITATLSGNASTSTSATSATTATNIAGGAAGSLPYQSAAATTAMLAIGSTGNVLTVVGGVPAWAAPATSGTVTSVSVVTANGVSGSVATATTTPAITLTLGAITPSSVAASGTVTGSNVSGSTSGTNTGDQTITLTGDVTGSGTGSFATTLATVNSGPVSNSFQKVTTNGKGLVTATSAVSSSDITTALGYTPVNKAGDSMSGTLTFDATHTVTNIPAPVSGTDAANKNYVDAAVAGLEWKASVNVATLVNGTLATAFANGQVVDTVTLATGNRILIKNQTTQTENGIYVVQASGAPVRSTDANTSSLLNNATLYVISGSQADTGWTQLTANPTIGSSNIVFAQFSGAGTYVAGTGLSLTGNTFANTGVLTLTTSSGLSTNTSATGNVSITNTGVTSIVAGTNISVSGATGAVTVNVNGTVTAATTATNLAGGAANSIPYQTGSGATTFLAQGTGVLQETAGAPAWTTTPTLTGTNFSGTAASLNIGGTAGSLSGGSAGTLPYQSAANTTAMLAAGTSGQTLLSGGAGAPTWGSAIVALSGTTGSIASLTAGNSSATSTAGAALTLVAGNGNGTTSNGGAASLTAGNGSSTGGAVTIAAGTGTTAGGALIFSTATTTSITERFRILANGQWNLAGTAATSGQVLTTVTAGNPPVWQSPTTGVPALTATTIGYGDGSGLLTGTTNFTFATASNTLTLGINTNSGATIQTPTISGSTGSQPDLNIIAGGSTTSTAGAGRILMTGGNITSGGTGVGGAIQITAGGGNSNTGGGLVLTSGGSNTGSGGNLSLVGGVGGTAGGAILFSTAPTTTSTERFRILANGAWSVGTGGTATGTSGQVLASGGSAAVPTWTSTPTLTATNFSGTAASMSIGGTATTATSLSGGSAGTIPYQSGAATTAMLAAGTSGQALLSGGAGAPTWGAVIIGINGTTGANASITAGNSTATSTNGGTAAVTSGNGTGTTSTGGTVSITAGTGTTAGGIITFTTSATTTPSEKMRIDATGNVGIGATPSFRLDVVGTVNVRDNRNLGTTLGAKMFGGDATTNPWIGSNYSAPFELRTNAVAAVLVDTTGNVSFGGTSPTAAIEVVRAATTNAEFVLRGNNNTYALGLSIQQHSDSDAYIFQRANANMYFGTNSLERMRIDSTGKVGIGGASTGANLEVIGASNPYFSVRSTSATPVDAFLQAIDTLSVGGAGTINNYPFTLWTNSVRQVTLDTTGNLGIGTTTTTYKLNVAGDIYIQPTTGTNDALLRLNNTGGNAYVGLDSSGGGLGGQYTLNVWHGGNFPVVFANNNVERARIDTSGDFLVGTTSIGSSNTNSVGLGGNSNTGTVWVNHLSGSTSGANYEVYSYNGTSIGSVTQNGTTAVLYNTTSDVRLKENIVDAPSAGNDIDAMKVRSFDWKSAPDETVKYGFIAQELVEVAPQAVQVGDNNPTEITDTWGVDYSKLVPLLVKEIQELRKRVAALEAK